MVNLGDMLVEIWEIQHGHAWLTAQEYVPNAFLIVYDNVYFLFQDCMMFLLVSCLFSCFLPNFLMSIVVKYEIRIAISSQNYSALATVHFLNV